MRHFQRDYHSYLLRIWRVKEDGDAWRASLEEVRSGELRGFSNLAALLSYLEGVISTCREAEALTGQPEE